ncbi:MAG: hypothetical protein HYV04_08125 [Deltaproteobacteria bacterium]|nr:hypothetical protein [Deltaproteobacteria bacterium]
MGLAIVGKPVGRVEGPEKVSGKATYTADLILPGMIWGKVLRSTLPHARILHINTSKARALPGVLAVITAHDIPDVLIGRSIYDMPVLAKDRVRSCSREPPSCTRSSAPTNTCHLTRRTSPTPSPT